MSNTVSFSTVEFNNPDKFLPSGVCFIDDDLFWIKPAYAAWKDTEEPPEILAARISGIYDITPLLPNMKRIANDSSSTKHQKEYIDKFTTASKTLAQWLQSYQSDALGTKTVNNWKETCNTLIDNPHFDDEWSLPAFFTPYILINAGMHLNSSLTQAQQHTLNEPNSGSNRNNSPKPCSQHGKLSTLVPALTKEFLSPNVCGTTITNMCTSPSNHKYGKNIFRMLPSTHGEDFNTLCEKDVTNDENSNNKN